MTDFLGRLVERTLAPAPAIRPRLASLFEPQQEAVGGESGEPRPGADRSPTNTGIVRTQGIQSVSNTPPEPDFAGAESPQPSISSEGHIRTDNPARPLKPAKDPVAKPQVLPIGKAGLQSTETPAAAVSRENSASIDRPASADPDFVQPRESRTMAPITGKGITAAHRQGTPDSTPDGEFSNPSPLTIRKSEDASVPRRKSQQESGVHRPSTSKESGPGPSKSAPMDTPRHPINGVRDRDSDPGTLTPANTKPTSSDPIPGSTRPRVLRPQVIVSRPNYEAAESSHPANSTARSSPPEVHISIGRVEIRAVTPRAPARSHATSPPRLSLDDYLKRSRAGK